MWKFWQKSKDVELSESVRILLEKQRGVGAEGDALRMVSQAGHYADRAVTYFRVYDPRAVARAGKELRSYEDLDAVLVLYSGHIERDGVMVLDGQPSPK